MKILFVDLIDWDYDIASPLERSLGGSQSALCYLAQELVARGHKVSLICGTSRPGEILGIDCVSFKSIPQDYIKQFDRVIALNGPAELCRNLRPHMAPGVPLVLWNQHAHDQPAMFGLRDPQVRAGWDWIVVVTDLHRQLMIEHYGLDPTRISVIKNAMSPLFERLFSDADELRHAKAGPPILTFTSTPFRGLDILLYAFPQIRAEFPEARLHVYSSMTVYQQSPQNDPYSTLYKIARSLPNCLYVGSISQPRLAAELRRSSILAYTNTFAEMACISVMEAMAAGLYVVTTDLGALSDTMMGFGTLVPPVSETPTELTGPSVSPPVVAGQRLPTQGELAYVRRYVEEAKRVLERRARDPVGFHQGIWEQVQATRKAYSWRDRAAEWDSYLETH